MKLKLDLHDIYNRGQDIDRALREIIDEAVALRGDEARETRPRLDWPVR